MVTSAGVLLKAQGRAGELVLGRGRGEAGGRDDLNPQEFKQKRSSASLRNALEAFG